MDCTLTIQQVAEITGLSSHTLRYYERAGLLEPVVRNEGGHRRYSERDVDALLFLTRLRLTGMPIHQVRRYADLARQGPDTTEERKRILEEHRQNLLDQIAAMQQNMAVLDYKIGLYERGWVPKEGDPCLAELRKLCGVDEQSLVA